MLVWRVKFKPAPETAAVTVTLAGNPVWDSTSCWLTLIPAGVNSNEVPPFGFTAAVVGFTVPVPVAVPTLPTVTGNRMLSEFVPEVATTVMLAKPTTAFDAAVRVNVVSGEVVLSGMKVAVTPAGRFDAVQATTDPGSTRPQRRATFTVAPGFTETDAGFAVTAVAAPTVNAIFVVRARDFTVISVVPVGAPEPIKVRVTDGLVAVAGVKAYDTFDGRFSTLKSRKSAKVPVRAILIVEVTEPNDGSVTAAGSAVRLKSLNGAVVVGAKVVGATVVGGGSVAAGGAVVAGVVGSTGSGVAFAATTILIDREDVLPLLEPVNVAERVFGATEASTVIRTVVVVPFSGFAAVLILTPRGTERAPRKIGDVNPRARTAVSVNTPVVPGAMVTVPEFVVKVNGTLLTADDCTSGTAAPVPPRTPAAKSMTASLERLGLRGPLVLSAPVENNRIGTPWESLEKQGKWM